MPPIAARLRFAATPTFFHRPFLRHFVIASMFIFFVFRYFVFAHFHAAARHFPSSCFAVAFFPFATHYYAIFLPLLSCHTFRLLRLFATIFSLSLSPLRFAGFDATPLFFHFIRHILFFRCLLAALPFHYALIRRWSPACRHFDITVAIRYTRYFFISAFSLMFDAAIAIAAAFHAARLRL